MQPEQIVTCPYNCSHKILRSRFSAHLCKCRKQHPHTTFTLCPFNATHNVPVSELEYHVENCPDKRKLDSHLYVSASSSKKYIATNIDIPPPSEDWDEEPSASTSYLDMRDEILSKKPVLRLPAGKSKSERRKFFENEVQKFGNFSKGEVVEPRHSVTPTVPIHSENKRIGSSVDAISSRIGLGRGLKSESSSSKPSSTSAEDIAEDDDDDEFTIVLRNRGRGRATKR